VKRHAARPPRLAVRLLSHLLPEELREHFLGDLEEAFHQNVAPARGIRAARRWYWAETLRALVILRPRPYLRAMAARRTTGDGPMTNLLADLRYAIRLTLRRPGYSALIILTLALGVGATTGIFSVVYPILFAPLPYPEADRVVVVWERDLDGTESNVGYATFHDVARMSRSFSALAAASFWTPVITGGTTPERLVGQKVSSDFFSVFGVRPALGRAILPEEDRPGAARVVILSDGLWRRRFGGDSSLVGGTIELSGVPFTVVGIMPPGFDNLLEPGAQLWTALRYDEALPYACRTCRHLRVLGRLRSGTTLPQARRELTLISRQLVSQHPTEYPAAGMLVPTLREQVTGGVRTALLTVFGAVVLVLLIACANVANLLLARASQREGEFALRAALGAGRARVVRQLLTESVLLALLGGALGVGLAHLGVRAVLAFAPSLPRLDAITVNGPVLLFALAATTACGLAFGLAPALFAVRADLHRQLQTGTPRAAGGHRTTRSMLVVAEVALALVLLVGSGLLLRSVARLLAVSPGFEPRGVLTVQVEASGQRFNDDTSAWAFFDRVLAATRAIPAVRDAAYTSQLPLSSDFDGYGVHSESHPRANPEEDPSAFRYAVSPGYLETMRIPLIRGRSFSPADGRGQPPVALVNESLARRMWPNEDPIGQRIRVGGATDGPWRSIVGVTGDVKQLSLAGQSDAVYVPETQWPQADGALTLVVRTDGNPAGLAGAVRRAVWSVDKDQPIVRVATMPHLVAATAAQRRFTMVLFGTFAAIALVLAAAGIYGVLAGSVTERLREIGVRSALGASRGDIQVMVIRQGMRLTALGIGLGLAGALIVTRLLRSLLYGVSALDATTYAGVTGVLIGVALVACWVPAWRAARLDPAVTLRAE
jgi:putative ABC transport system permease protein